MRQRTSRASAATSRTQALVVVASAVLLGVAWGDDGGISAGWRHSCALLGDSTVKCFGNNEWGQLGTGDTLTRGDGASSSGQMGDELPTVSLGVNETAIGVSAGLSHTCALLESGRVKCWGRNNYGQLGVGDTDDRGDTTTSMGDNLASIDLGTNAFAIGVSAGAEFTCVLLDNGTVKCLGRNDEGQLGRGNLDGSIGSSPDDLGDALTAADLGTNTTATAISAGTSATCAVLADGTLKCWGSNAYGGLGLEDSYDRGDDSTDMGDNLGEVNLGSNTVVDSVYYGLRHVCAIVVGGNVKCWGDNRSGQLGLGHVDTVGDDSGEMGDGLPYVDLGTGEEATSLTLGESHTCAILASDGGVKCWGKGYWGQLGDGFYHARGKAEDEMGTVLPVVDLGTSLAASSLAAGHDHTCAALDDGSMKCWGLNLLGSLGLNDTKPRGDDSGEMGDYLPTVNLGTGVALLTIAEPTSAPTGAPSPAPTLMTPVPTQRPSPAPTTIPTAVPVVAVVVSPAPTVASRASLRSPAPSLAPIAATPDPTAADTVGDDEGGANVEVDEAAGDEGQSFLSGKVVLVAAIAAPLAALSLCVCLLVCRKRYRERDAGSASVAARESWRKDASDGLGGLGGHKAAVLGSDSERGAAAVMARSTSHRSVGSHHNVKIQPSTSLESISPGHEGAHRMTVDPFMVANPTNHEAGYLESAGSDGSALAYATGGSTSSASGGSASGGSGAIRTGSRRGADSANFGGGSGAPSPFMSRGDNDDVDEDWGFEHEDVLGEQRGSSFRGRNSELTLQRARSAGRPGVATKGWNERPGGGGRY